MNEQESAAAPLPPPSTELMFGAGQSAWLAVVTVGVLVALAVAFVALFMAMNDDDPAAAPSGGGGPQTAVTFDASEFKFDPDAVTVAADTDVSVTLDNVGSVEHNWTVLSAGTTITQESEYDDSLAGTSLVAEAGTNVSGTVNLPPGTYQFICTVPGHFSAGMHGTLEVAS